MSPGSDVAIFDIAIVGAGPAGLAVAIDASLLGLHTVVLDRAVPTIDKPAIDKACGEGVMPQGVACLERLGVRSRLVANDTAPIRSIAYIQGPNTRLEATLPKPGALGIRRTALSLAMLDRAREAGADVRLGTAVRDYIRDASQRDNTAELHTSTGPLRARFVVFADGLGSPFRHKLGLDDAAASRQRQRFGLRQHFALPPWNDSVEVHFGDGVEAYVTPAGQTRVGVAFLWTNGKAGSHPTVSGLLARFPALAKRLADQAHDSKPRGMGPLFRRSRQLVGDGFALVGDAAGYVDALTGEGISLALVTSQALAICLPRALAAMERHGIDGSPRIAAIEKALAHYQAVYREEYRRYAALSSTLLWIASRPRLRFGMLASLSTWPPLFQWLLDQTILPPTHASPETGKEAERTPLGFPS